MTTTRECVDHCRAGVSQQKECAVLSKCLKPSRVFQIPKAPPMPPQVGQRGVLWFLAIDGEVYGYEAEVIPSPPPPPWRIDDDEDDDRGPDPQVASFRTRVTVPREGRITDYPPYAWAFLADE